jgi:hypothetical protein
MRKHSNYPRRLHVMNVLFIASLVTEADTGSVGLLSEKFALLGDTIKCTLIYLVIKVILLCEMKSNKWFAFTEGRTSVQNNMHLESSTTAAPPPPTPSPAVWHPAPISINSEPYSIIDRSTGPCIVNHTFLTYNSPTHSQDISTSDTVVVSSTETLPAYSTAFQRHKSHNYSINLIPMSTRMDTHAAYMQVNTENPDFQNVENLTQEVKLENCENYTITGLSQIRNLGKGQYVQHSNMLHAHNGHESSISTNNTKGRQSCLDDITSLSGDTGCVYDGNGLVTISGQFPNDQSLMLPPIGSISAKPFHMHSEAEVNLRNLSSSSLSTRRSSARSDIVRGGNLALSASPLGDGVVDLTSLIRYSPTSLLAFSSSSCSQVSDFSLSLRAENIKMLTIMITEQTCVYPSLCNPGTLWN